MFMQNILIINYEIKINDQLWKRLDVLSWSIKYSTQF